MWCYKLSYTCVLLSLCSVRVFFLFVFGCWFCFFSVFSFKNYVWGRCQFSKSLWMKNLGEESCHVSSLFHAHGSNLWSIIYYAFVYILSFGISSFVACWVPFPHLIQFIYNFSITLLELVFRKWQMICPLWISVAQQSS